MRVDVFGDGVDAVFAGACGVRDSVSLAGTFVVCLVLLLLRGASIASMQES